MRVLHEAEIDVAANLEVIGAKEHELGQVATIAAESRGYLNACLKACGAVRQRLVRSRLISPFDGV